MKKQSFLWIFFVFYLATSCVLYSCGGSDEKKTNTPQSSVDPMTDKGIGPVSSLTLTAVNNDWAAEGQKIFTEKCTACHNPVKKLLGPPQKGVLDRRTPEWVLNMILNPQEMIDKDPVAKQLLKEYNNVPMTNQGLTLGEARKVLEYFRTL